MQDRNTVISFDGYQSDSFQVLSSLDQGCPLSGILYNFYNKLQIEGVDEKHGKLAASFVDDAINIAKGKTLEDATHKLRDMMERPGGGIEWAASPLPE
jgi:hypothetical protein